MNRRGERTEPCGRPRFINLVWLVAPAKRTLALLSVRNAFNHRMYFIGMFF